jgi:acyl carrier protein
MNSDTFPAPLPDAAGDRRGLTPTEHAIGGIWQRLFGLEAVSPSDHFFALGGDSMTAVGMIGEVEGLFDLALPAFLVFEAPTLASLSERVDRARRETDQETSRGIVFALASAGTGAPLFFNGIDRMLARQGLWTVPCPVFAIANGAAGANFTNARSLQSLATFYLDAVRRIQARGPYRLAGFSACAMIVLEMAQQLRAQDDEVELLFFLDPLLPEDLFGSGPEGAQPHSRDAFDLLFPHDRHDAFWLAMLRLLKAYNPSPYDGRAATVWSSDHAKPDKVANLLRTDARHYTLGDTHRALFEQPALHAWMNRLAENLLPP